MIGSNKNFVCNRCVLRKRGIILVYSALLAIASLIIGLIANSLNVFEKKRSFGAQAFGWTVIALSLFALLGFASALFSSSKDLRDGIAIGIHTGGKKDYRGLHYFTRNEKKKLQ
jgi:hypothetical protein